MMQSLTVDAIFSQSVQFVPLTPCRVYDTRPSHGGSGPIQGGTAQAFNLPQLSQAKSCGDLSSASAYSLNVTVIPQGTLGYLTLWPTGEGQPTVSTLNSVDGRVKANAAITPAGTHGAVSVYVTNTTDVVIDIDGYFAPVTGSTLAFYPLTPCRVVDTRKDSFLPDLGPPAVVRQYAAQLPGAGEHHLHSAGHQPAGVLVQLHSGAYSATSAGLSGSVADRAEPARGVHFEQPDGNDRGQCGHRAGRHQRRSHRVLDRRHPTCSSTSTATLRRQDRAGLSLYPVGALPRDRHAQDRHGTAVQRTN